MCPATQSAICLGPTTLHSIFIHHIYFRSLDAWLSLSPPPHPQHLSTSLDISTDQRTNETISSIHFDLHQTSWQLITYSTYHLTRFQGLMLPPPLTHTRRMSDLPIGNPTPTCSVQAFYSLIDPICLINATPTGDNHYPSPRPRSQPPLLSLKLLLSLD